MEQDRQENRAPFQHGKRYRAELVNNINPHLKSRWPVQYARIGGQVKTQKPADRNQPQQRMHPPHDKLVPAEHRG